VQGKIEGMRGFAATLTGLSLVGGAGQAAMPPAVRPLAEAVTFRPFELTVAEVRADRHAGTVELTVAYTVKNISDRPATAPALLICDPQGRLYPSAAGAAPLAAALAPGARADLKTRFTLPAAFDQALWLLAVGGANGPRIMLSAPR
jgi:hypothetical protein